MPPVKPLKLFLDPYPWELLESQTMVGLLTALVTPFDAQGGIDWASWDRLIAFQLDSGVQGLIVAGTTGEAPTLRDHEYGVLLERCRVLAAGRARVFAGIGSNATLRCLELMDMAHAAGADGLLVVTPYYNKPTQAGLLAHYKVLAAHTRLPIMVYSIPSRCGIQMEPQTMAALYEAFPHCCLLKESHTDCLRFSTLYRTLGSDFSLFSGDDAMSLPYISLGAKGLVSVASNRFPKEVSALVALALEGHLAQARACYHALAPLFEALFWETNPAPIKALLAQAGIIDHETYACL